MASSLPKHVDPTLAENWDRLKKDVRACVQSCKDGVPLPRLTADYADLVGGFLPFAKFGFSSVGQMLESMPDVVYFRRDRTGEINVMAVTDESTAHLSAMIAQQKSITKNKRGGVSSRRSCGVRGGRGGATRGRGAPAARFQAVHQPSSWRRSVNAWRISTAGDGFRQPLSERQNTPRGAWTTTAVSGSQDIGREASRGENSLSAAFKAHLERKTQNLPQQAPPGDSEQGFSGSQEIATRAHVSPSVPSTSLCSAAALRAFSRGRGKPLPTAALDKSVVPAILGLREIPAARSPKPAVLMARDPETEPTSSAARTPSPASPADRRSPAAASTLQPMNLPPGLDHWCSNLTATLDISTSKSETPTVNHAGEYVRHRVTKQGLAGPPEVRQELDISLSEMKMVEDIRTMSLDDYQKTINCGDLFEQLRYVDKPSVGTDDPDEAWAEKLLRPSEGSTPMTRWEALRITEKPTNAMTIKLESLSCHKRSVQSLRETVQGIMEKCDKVIQLTALNLELVREDGTGVDPATCGMGSLEQAAEETVDKPFESEPKTSLTRGIDDYLPHMSDACMGLARYSEESGVLKKLAEPFYPPWSAAVEESLPPEDQSLKSLITDQRLLRAVTAAPFVPSSTISFVNEDMRRKGLLDTRKEGSAIQPRRFRAAKAAPFVSWSLERHENEERAASSGKTPQNLQGVREEAVIIDARLHQAVNAAPFHPSPPNAASDAVHVSMTETGLPIVAGVVNPRPIFFSTVTSPFYNASDMPFLK